MFETGAVRPVEDMLFDRLPVSIVRKDAWEGPGKQFQHLRPYRRTPTVRISASVSISRECRLHVTASNTLPLRDGRWSLVVRRRPILLPDTLTREGALFEEPGKVD